MSRPDRTTVVDTTWLFMPPEAMVKSGLAPSDLWAQPGAPLSQFAASLHLAIRLATLATRATTNGRDPVDAVSNGAIEDRHQVTKREFEEAWRDRDEPFSSQHPVYGAYFEGFGYTDAGRPLYLVWRWQDEDRQQVWPITAYEPATETQDEQGE